MTLKNFTVYGQPTGKARVRVTKWGSYTPEVTVLYENLIKVEYARQCKSYMFDKGLPLSLAVRAYYTIPASASNKRKELMRAHQLRPLTKPDWDNVGKSIGDALNKIAFHDDAQIVCAIVQKFYSDQPRIEITIEQAT